MGNVYLYSLRTRGYSVTFLVAICGLMSERLWVERVGTFQQEEIARAEISRHSEAPASGVMTDGLVYSQLSFLAGPAKP